MSKKIVLSAIVLLILFIIYNHFQISQVYINKVRIKSPKINNAIKITQITDFHSNNLINLEKIYEEISQFNPDIVVLTGDIIDFKTKDLELALHLVENLMKITPEVYFVNGNHEIRSIFSKELTDKMIELGAVFMENKTTVLNINGESICLSGVGFFANKEDYQIILNGLKHDTYNILLSHSPNRPIRYLTGLEDLILSGHTHGGQIRLPLIGAIVAPGQNMFPKFDKGIFNLGDTILYIDSGLGNSVYPIRTLNRVQISNITIESNK